MNQSTHPIHRFEPLAGGTAGEQGPAACQCRPGYAMAEVILAFDPAADAYRFSATLMRQRPLRAASLKADAARIRRDAAWKKKGDDNVRRPCGTACWH